MPIAPAARDDDRPRQVVGEDLLLVRHHARAALGAGQQPGGGAGGDDAVLEADRARLAVVARHLEGVRVEEGAAAVDLRDLVLLHQVVDALDPAVRDPAAAAERLAVVEGDLPLDLDAEGLRLAGEDVRQLGVPQQGLGRDAAHVQTDTAPVLLLDHGDPLAELGGTDGGDVAAGAWLPSTTTSNRSSCASCWSIERSFPTVRSMAFWRSSTVSRMPRSSADLARRGQPAVGSGRGTRPSSAPGTGVPRRYTSLR